MIMKKVTAKDTGLNMLLSMLPRANRAMQDRLLLTLTVILQRVRRTLLTTYPAMRPKKLTQLPAIRLPPTLLRLQRTTKL